MDLAPDRAAPQNGQQAGSWSAAARRIATAAVQGGRLTAHLEQERARWFVWLPVCFGAGIAVYFSRPDEPGLVVALALPAMAAGLMIASRAAGFMRLAAAGLMAASLGFTAAKFRTEWTRAPVLGHEMRRADVRGIVELIEPRPGRGERLTLRVTDIRGLSAQERPARVRIRAMTKREGLAPGDAVRIRATLRPPATPALPGGYDFARTAWFQGLGATGYALVPADIETPAASAPQDGSRQAVRDRLERLRQAIAERIRAAVPGETGAIAVSLITGERGGITEATNDAYRDSGLVHILSISGLHMVIMAGAVFVSVRILLAAFPAIALRFATKKWAAAAAVIGALGYLLVSGSSTATIRAFLMISIMFVAVMLDRQALAMRNVAIAALIILVAMPESLLDAGFQMSFAAVVSLIAAYEAARSHAGEQDRSGWLRPLAFFLGGIVLSTVIASISVAPLGAYHFHRSQQYALLANLVAVPICNLIVMPAGLVTLLALPLGLEAVPLAVMAKGIDAMTWTAGKVAALPGAVIALPEISQLSFALMVLGGLWLTLWQTRWRGLGLVAIGAGIVLAAGGTPHPDILAGRNGELVAVRGSDGLLTALGPRSGGFELTRWLEHDGDARSARDAVRGRDGARGRIAGRSSAFRCDGSGCTADVDGLRVAVARHPSATAEDCVKSDILIGGPKRPAGCSGPLAVIDRQTLRRDGTHALYLERNPEGGRGRIIKIETVASRRGARPWSARPEPPRRWSNRNGDARSGDAGSEITPSDASSEAKSREDNVPPRTPQPKPDDNQPDGDEYDADQ